MTKKKTRWWMVILIVLGAMMLLGVLAIGGMVWWVDANKDRLVAQAKGSTADGRAYAADHDQNACVDEGLRKVATCGGFDFVCEANTKIFTMTCIENARPTPGFCDGVPPKTEIVKTSLWVVDECRRRGRAADDPRCQRHVQAVPEACHAKTTSTPAASP